MECIRITEASYYRMMGQIRNAGNIIRGTNRIKTRRVFLQKIKIIFKRILGDLFQIQRSAAVDLKNSFLLPHTITCQVTWSSKILA